jgi:hypothetical protein
VDRLLELKAPPVIGQKYLVPCMKVFYEFVPVFGPAHSDPELDNPVQHIHLDIRFLTDKDIERLTHGDSRADLTKNETNFITNIPVVGVTVKNPEIIEKKKLCVRECLDLRGYETPLGGTLKRHIPDAELNEVMENQQEHKILNLSCKICPHRGFPLNSVPVYDSVVVCPGHGLQWCVKTGKLIRRTGAASRHILKKGTQEVLV